MKLIPLSIFHSVIYGNNHNAVCATTLAAYSVPSTSQLLILWTSRASENIARAPHRHHKPSVKTLSDTTRITHHFLGHLCICRIPPEKRTFQSQIYTVLQFSYSLGNHLKKVLSHHTLQYHPYNQLGDAYAASKVFCLPDDGCRKWPWDTKQWGINF